MECSTENKNPTEKVNNNQTNKNADGFTQITNDNDMMIIDDVFTRCIISDNTKKNQNNIKHAKLDNDSDSIKTVLGCNDDIISKKASKFIKKVLHNELPKNKQSSLVSMILSRQSTRLSQLHLEDEIFMKTAELLTVNSRYEQQYNDIKKLKNLQCIWKRKFKRLNLYINSINRQLDTLPILPNPVVKRVRNVGTQISQFD